MLTRLTEVNSDYAKHGNVNPEVDSGNPEVNSGYAKHGNVKAVAFAVLMEAS
jgi:hypothetical protein